MDLYSNRAHVHAIWRCGRHHSRLKAIHKARLMSVPALVTSPAMCSILSSNCCITLQTHFSTSSPVIFRPLFGWDQKRLMARRCILKCMSALRYEIWIPVGGKRPMAKFVVTKFANAEYHGLQSSFTLVNIHASFTNGARWLSCCNWNIDYTHVRKSRWITLFFWAYLSPRHLSPEIAHFHQSTLR